MSGHPRIELLNSKPMSNEIKIGDEIVVAGVIGEIDKSDMEILVDFIDSYEWITCDSIKAVNGGEHHANIDDYKVGDNVQIVVRVIDTESDGQLGTKFIVKFENGDGDDSVLSDDIVGANNIEHQPTPEDLAYIRDQIHSWEILMQARERQADFWLRISAIMLTVSIILSTIAFFKA